MLRMRNLITSVLREMVKGTDLRKQNVFNDQFTKMKAAISKREEELQTQVENQIKAKKQAQDQLRRAENGEIELEESDLAELTKQAKQTISLDNVMNNDKVLNKLKVEAAEFTEDGEKLINTLIALAVVSRNDDVVVMPYRASDYRLPAINLSKLIAWSERNGWSEQAILAEKYAIASNVEDDFDEDYLVQPDVLKRIFNLFLIKTNHDVKDCTTTIDKKESLFNSYTYLFDEDGDFYKLKDQPDNNEWMMATALKLTTDIFPLDHIGNIETHQPSDAEIAIWAMQPLNSGNGNQGQSKNKSGGGFKRRRKIKIGTSAGTDDRSGKPGVESKSGRTEV